MASNNKLRIAAVADLHYGQGNRDMLAALVAQAAAEGDVLLLCGDLTDHGRPAEAKMLVEDLQISARTQIFAVLGNHDMNADRVDELVEVLEAGQIRMLDGECAAVGSVGFAGVRGFGGGFGHRAVHAFGERELKNFINATIDQALRLETALSRLDTTDRVVMLHYAPIRETVEGEPLEIFPFMGSSRLEDPVNHYEASVVFHGHSHKGQPIGQTSYGIPVYNVAVPVLKSNYPDQPAYRIYEIDRSGKRAEDTP